MLGLTLTAAGGLAVVLATRHPVAGMAYDKGVALSRQGEHREAIGKFTWSILLGDRDVRAYHARARSYLDVGEPPKAVADLTAALRQDPHRPDLFMLRGRIRQEGLGDFRLALRDFDRAIELGPPLARLHLMRARIYARLNNAHRALKDYSRAIALQPGGIEGYLGRAGVLSTLGREREVIADLSAVIRLRPGVERFHVLRANVYMVLGDHASAVADYGAALAVAPSAGKYFARANALLKLGAVPAAIADFSRAIALDPRHLAAYFHRARAHEASGQLRKARADWTAVCHLQPYGFFEACSKAVEEKSG